MCAHDRERLLIAEHLIVVPDAVVVGVPVGQQGGLLRGALSLIGLILELML